MEALSDFAVTIPELGRSSQKFPRWVILTSNRTREVHDALKRRCLYHWVEHPSLEREVAILRSRLPGITAQLIGQVATAVGRLRTADLLKPPGVAEPIDWTMALQALGCRSSTRSRRDGSRRGGEVPGGNRPGGPPAGCRRWWPDRCSHRCHRTGLTRGELRRDGVADGVQLGAARRRCAGRRRAGCHLLVRDGVAGCHPTARRLLGGTADACRKPRRHRPYNAVFDAYFTGRTAPVGPRRPGQASPLSMSHADSADTGDEADGPPPVKAKAAATEILRHRDFSALSAADRHEFSAMLALLRPGLSQRLSRRRRGPVGVRRTVRAMLTTGGELGRLQRRRNGHPPRPGRAAGGCLRVDGPHADALLRFAHVLVRQQPTAVEVFTIGTRLFRITRALRLPDPDAALRAASEVIPDFSGGTRLGAAGIRRPVGPARNGPAARWCAVIRRVGARLDRPAGRAVQRLRRLNEQLVWVNPHKAKDGYLPVQTGAVLPHLDAFVAGHSLATLEELLEVIRDA